MGLSNAEVLFCSIGGREGMVFDGILCGGFEGDAKGFASAKLSYEDEESDIEEAAGREGFGAIVGRGGVGAPQGSASRPEEPESHGFARYAGTGADVGFSFSTTTAGFFAGCFRRSDSNSEREDVRG
jgi:hypothetical protein